MPQEVSPKKTRVHRSEAMPCGGTMTVGPALTTYLKKKGQYGKEPWNRYEGARNKNGSRRLNGKEKQNVNGAS
jgi:hypothetical protein